MHRSTLTGALDGLKRRDDLLSSALLNQQEPTPVPKWFTAWRRDRILRRQPIDDAVWQEVVHATKSLAGLNDNERTRLRELATIFVAEKPFVGTHDLIVTDFMRVAVAAQACLLILNLGFGYYRGWYTVVLYPGAFVAHREVADDDGIVHTGYEELDGESMAGGPMALSWEESDPRNDERESNVVFHECAHKLDELNGEPNGMPPLGAGMSISAWSTAFARAFEEFSAEAELAAQEEDLEFDDYAATDAAEFFAVMTEAFFETPAVLLDEYPAVYEQMRLLYRQDPVQRLASESVSVVQHPLT